MATFRLGFAAGSLLCALSVAGCSSDDAPSAPESCYAFVAKVCERITACQVDDGRIPSAQAADSEATCVETGNATVACDRAVVVGTTYSACMTKLDTVTCSTLLAGTLPDDCFGAIVTR